MSKYQVSKIFFVPWVAYNMLVVYIRGLGYIVAIKITSDKDGHSTVSHIAGYRRAVSKASMLANYTLEL